jgi:hypothetical protein
MKYRLLIVALVALTTFNCNYISCSQYMDKLVEHYDDDYGFNYYSFSDDFFQYLISREIIDQYSREEVAVLLKEKSYCQIDLEDYNLSVDHWLATGPGFGSSMIEWSNTQRRCVLPTISLDSLDAGDSRFYIAGIVESLDSDQFDNRFSKAFLAYMINNYFYRDCRQKKSTID